MPGRKRFRPVFEEGGRKAAAKGKNMTQKQKTLVGGVSVLAAAGMICKVVGVIYRIPLANTVGGEGLGLYSKVFQSYNLLLTVSSAGIPVAISRMVSHYVTKEEEGTARRVFITALWALFALGLIATLLLAAFSTPLAELAGAPEIGIGYIAIAPSLLLVCVMSAFRGYLQGHRVMLPTAISQLIEQVGKLAVALPLAVLGMNKGGPAMGAAGMLLGTSIAEGAALCFMVYAHLKEKKRRAEAGAESSLTDKKILSKLAGIAVPITIGACIVPLAGWIDSFMVTRLIEGNGVEHADALLRYGLYSSVVLSLINVPTAIAMAVSTNLVPDISSGMAKGDMPYVRRESAAGLRMASVIGIPCSVGLCLLAKPILYMLFLGKYTPQQLDLAAEILRLSALTIALFTMVQATSGILQGCGKQRLPMYTLAAGVACKIVLNILLIGTPSVDIHGAPIASLVCYTVSMVPNLYFVRKYTGTGLSVSDLLLRPLAASAVMGAVVWAVWRFAFGDAVLTESRPLTLLGVILCLGLGVAVYAVCVLLFGAVRGEDLPGAAGRAVGKLERKLFPAREKR